MNTPPNKVSINLRSLAVYLDRTKFGLKLAHHSLQKMQVLTLYIAQVPKIQSTGDPIKQTAELIGATGDIFLSESHNRIRSRANLVRLAGPCWPSCTYLYAFDLSTEL